MLHASRRAASTAVGFVLSGCLALGALGCASAPKKAPVTQEGLAAGDLSAAPSHESRANDPAYNPNSDVEWSLPEQQQEAAKGTGAPVQSMRMDDSAKKNKLKVEKSAEMVPGTLQSAQKPPAQE